MTSLVNDPDAFAAQALAGLVAAHPGELHAVRGGVVRARPTAPGQVAVVLGGGSGHHPAFAGWVGPGFAHGAACGGVFASPSAAQIRSVARAAEAGGGVLLGYGCYAGDVLHFGLAAEMLRAEGLDVREVAVTDDIASAEVAEVSRRRGIAGDLVVLKAAGAAAEAGLSLDEVEQVARRANDRTRTFGVALSGCTLPGAGRPLFTLSPGQMGVGMGIHGEPGLGERPVGTADEVADLLLAGVLAEQPDRDDGHDGGSEGRLGYRGRVAVVVNGLGSVTHEELFVLYRRVAAGLDERGLVPVRPEVGEHVTSLDMAGVSLTLSFLDDDLKRWWTAPADAPSLRRGQLVEPPPEALRPAGAVEADDDVPVPEGSEGSRAAAPVVVRGLALVARVLSGAADRLGELDAVAGDGDHGTGMTRGSRAAAATSAALDARAGCGSVLARAADAWAETAGGTSGALWGAALTAASRVLGDERAPGADEAVRAVRAGVDAVVRLGGARPGDKTMVDAALPFADELERAHAAGSSLPGAWEGAAARATAAAEATADLRARLGRARAHGDSSLGTPDAGATSFALVVTALGRAARDDDRDDGRTGTADDVAATDR